MSRTSRRKNDGSWGEYDQHRDKKVGWKPPSHFKKDKRRQERAQTKDAIRNGAEPEVIKKDDVWDWN